MITAADYWAKWRCVLWAHLKEWGKGLGEVLSEGFKVV